MPPSSPGYFENYLSQRWAAGCTHGRYLFWDIRYQGYTGSYSHLQKFLATWRLTSSETLAASQPSEPENPALDPTTGWQILPIDAAWLCLKPRGQLTPSQAVKIDALKQASPGSVSPRAKTDFCAILLRQSRSQYWKQHFSTSRHR
jgi:hypothetical protein